MCRRRHNLDNGSSFVSKQLLRALAILGVRLVHSRPGKPQGRGKIERFFRTVRDQFLVEASHSEIPTLEVLEARFVAWVERVYHARVHSETSETPLDRFGVLGAPHIPSMALVREAFLFAETRTVTKLATVSLFANHYEVDQALIGRRVELVFDPLWKVFHKGSYVRSRIMWLVQRRPLATVLGGVSS